MQIDLTPTFPPAYRALFEKHWRYIVYYGGRGGGKSWAVADALLVLGCMEPLRILCARELQISIADSVHRLLSDRIEELGLQAFYRITQKSIEGVNGTMFLFKGIRHNSTEIKSTEGIDVCWVEEAEKVSRNSWEVLIPTIRKENSRIIVTFNTKSVTDATYERFILSNRENTFVRKVSWRDNPFFPDVLNRERLDMLARDPEAYAHIWEGEPDTRYSGGVYAIQMARAVADGRVLRRRTGADMDGLYDPELPVHTAWDLGRKDSTAIWWWQKAGTEIRLIDYYENSLKDNIDHYLEQVYGRRLLVTSINPINGMVTGWKFGEPVLDAKHRMHWKYGKHYVPHDAANKLLAAGGRSIVQQAHVLGVKFWVVAATSQQNGIAAARKTIDCSWFDEVRCAYGIRCLNSYHFPYDEDKQRFGDTPVHDWASDCADAYEIIGQVWRNEVKEKEPEKPKFLAEATANDLFWPENVKIRQERI